MLGFDSARDSFIFTGPMPGIRVRNLTNWEVSYYLTGYASGMGSRVTRSWTEMLNLGDRQTCKIVFTKEGFARQELEVKSGDLERELENVRVIVLEKVVE